MKRLIALALVLLIMVSGMSLSVFAVSETYTGSYGGYSYLCFARITSSLLNLKMTYGNSNKTITIDGTFDYWDVYGHIQHGDIYISTHSQIITSPNPDYFNSFDSVSVDYKIGATVIQSISLAV